MGIFTPRITRQRLTGAFVVLLVSVVLAYLVDIDMAAFSLGLLFGFAVVGIVVAVMLVNARRNGPGR